MCLYSCVDVCVDVKVCVCHIGADSLDRWDRLIEWVRLAQSANTPLASRGSSHWYY